MGDGRWQTGFLGGLAGQNGYARGEFAVSHGTMKDHRTLDAWKEAHAVALGVTLASRDHWKPWASAIFSQANRAALSVQLNITEGWTFSRSPTATRHLAIAYGSAKETADLLHLMAETGALPAD